MATPAGLCKAKEAWGEVWEREKGTKDQRGSGMATQIDGNLPRWPAI
jgi:hypothetical protein